jgi:hypothetical protein
LSDAVRGSVSRRLRRIRIVVALPLHLAVILASTLRVAAQTSAPLLQPDEQSLTVRGTVVNSVNGTPIPRALVFAPGNRFAMFTDGEGHFEFELPKTNRGSGVESQPTFNSTMLIARKPGFLDDPNGGSQREATPGTNVTIPLLPEALIKGRIVFTQTDPPLGATVNLYSRQVQDGMPRWMQAGSTRTNSSGEFRFAELRPGSYRVGTDEVPDNDPATRIVGQEFGFSPVYYPGVSDFAAAGTIQLTAGETVEADVPLTRQPYYPVKIPVVNGETVNYRLMVTVSLAGHQSPGYSLGYNAAEQRIEGSLPRGNYLVEAFTQGDQSVAGSVHLAVASAPAESPSLVLTPGSSIPVHVVEQFNSNDWNGEGVWNQDGRQIQLHGQRLYLNISAERVDDFAKAGGSLRPPSGRDDDPLILEALAPGRYWLRLHTGRGYVASATMGAVDLLHAPFAISAGSSTPIEITMRDDAAEIEGTIAGVVAPADNAVRPGGFAPSAFIYCIPTPDSPGQFLELTAASDGKIDYRSVAPGTYRVLAFKTRQPNLPYRDADAMKVFESSGQIVHFNAGQKTTVQLQIISTNE